MCACGLSLQSCVAQLLVSVVGLCGAREQLDHTRAFKKARIAIPWLLLRLKLELLTPIENAHVGGVMSATAAVASIQI